MKIVAIATVADSVPLTGENRVIARLGLEELRKPVNPGLKALMEVAELNHGRALTAAEVAFRIAPRMNAAGRMNVARDVVDLFTLKDKDQVREIAHRLDRLNAERQAEEARITEAIREKLERSPELANAGCVVVDGEGWHRGVIGICASRVVERCHRPAVVIARDGDEAHGSGRSIPGFHLLNALESCPELFLRYGGHAAAVGFAIAAENIPELSRRMDSYASQHLTAADYEPALEFDAELALDQLAPTLWEQLSQLAPFGIGNPEPIFVARGVECSGEPRILKEKHLKLKLKRYAAGAEFGPQSRLIDALGWGMAERLVQAPIAGGDQLDVAVRVEQNRHPEFGGALQLVLCDFRPAKPVTLGKSVGE